jgi:ATP adenylyltransferase
MGKVDPFLPPYVPDLYVGELKGEEPGEDYVVLVSV